MQGVHRALLGAGLAVGLLICGSSAEAQAVSRYGLGPIEFDTAVAWIVSDDDSVRLTVELAESPQQRMRGFQDRTAIPANHGMLFRYGTMQDPSFGFWMWRTRVPIDIAYLARDGTILRILTMMPCPEDVRDCKPHPAGVRFRSALEVNRGFFDKHGVRPGAVVRVQDSRR